MTPDFPGNSKIPKENDPQKKVESVVTHEVVARKKTLGRRLKELFIGGDSKTVVQYIIMDVVIPQAKDMITDAAGQGLERLIYGDSRPSRRFGHRGPSPINYNRYSQRGNNPIGRALRDERLPNAEVRKHDIDDILFATRVEAEHVLENMGLLLEKYDIVTVSDLRSLIGWSSGYMDHKWGWRDLREVNLRRTRDGYTLELPRPEFLE